MADLVQHFMSNRPVILSHRSSVRDAARAMEAQHVGTVLIGDRDGNIGGILTDRDIACSIVAHDHPHERSLSEFLDPEAGGPVTVAPTDELSEAIRVMRENGVRRLVVLDQTSTGRERCMGVLSLDDLITARRISIDDTAEVIRTQVRKHLQTHGGHERSERRKSHRLDEFNKRMGEHLGIETGEAGSIALTVLRNLVERITYAEAACFIAQLPQKLQEDLWNVEAGPDTSISAETIINELSDLHDLSEEEARELMPRFWKGLMAFLNLDSPYEGETANVLSQLPREMQILFGCSPHFQEEIRQHHERKRSA